MPITPNYRFLETDDEYFNYSAQVVPEQGQWQIYGLNLQAPVFENIYYKNAAGLFGITKKTVQLVRKS